MLWQGDFHNARQILNALDRRVGSGKKKTADSPADEFYRHRQSRSHRARVLVLLLIPLDPGPVVPLRRAPDIQAAAEEAYGDLSEPSVVSLRELVGLVGAHEWRRKGVGVGAAGPHPSALRRVLAGPQRVRRPGGHRAAALGSLAFDIGTGTGVLAAVLARRGVERVVATDNDPARWRAPARTGTWGCRTRARWCRPTFPARPGAARRVQSAVDSGHAHPPGARLYDPDSRMLRGFLGGLAAHLAPGGEGWLVLSDLAEHLGLRTRTTCWPRSTRPG